MKKIILIAGESGSGKSTVVDELCKHEGFNKIVSWTSRKPRDDFDDHNFGTKEKLGDMMKKMPYVASTLIDDEIYVAFESQFTDEINVYIVDELGALNVLNHIWWDVKKPIRKHEVLCVKLLNENNNVEDERKERFGLFLNDSFYNLIIENENIDETVGMIIDEANRSMDN